MSGTWPKTLSFDQIAVWRVGSKALPLLGPLYLSIVAFDCM